MYPRHHINKTTNNPRCTAQSSSGRSAKLGCDVSEGRGGLEPCDLSPSIVTRSEVDTGSARTPTAQSPVGESDQVETGLSVEVSPWVSIGLTLKALASPSSHGEDSSLARR